MLHYAAILMFDSERFEFVRDVVTLVDGRWVSERRSHPFADIFFAEARDYVPQTLISTLNMLSYWMELRWYFGDDRALLFALLFANALSPHRHLCDTETLPVAVRLHARCVQLLKQYVCEWRAPALQQLQRERLHSYSSLYASASTSTSASACTSPPPPDFNALVLSRVPLALRELAARLISRTSIRAHLQTSTGDEVRALYSHCIVLYSYTCFTARCIRVEDRPQFPVHMC